MFGKKRVGYMPSSSNQSNQFELIYDYAIRVIKSLDKQTAIVFLEFVIDYIKKDIESTKTTLFIPASKTETLVFLLTKFKLINGDKQTTEPVDDFRLALIYELSRVKYSI